MRFGAWERLSSQRRSASRMPCEADWRMTGSCASVCRPDPRRQQITGEVAAVDGRDVAREQRRQRFVSYQL